MNYRVFFFLFFAFSQNFPRIHIFAHVRARVCVRVCARARETRICVYFIEEITFRARAGNNRQCCCCCCYFIRPLFLINGAERSAASVFNGHHKLWLCNDKSFYSDCTPLIDPPSPSLPPRGEGGRIYTAVARDLRSRNAPRIGGENRRRESSNARFAPASTLIAFGATHQKIWDRR